MSSLAPPYREMKKYRLLGWGLWLLSLLCFLGGNVAFSVLVHRNPGDELLVILRVVLLDGLFLVMAITLGVLIMLIYTTRAGRDVLETQGVHKCWPLLFSLSLILLFVSRALYDIIALCVADVKSFGFGWTFATDMADYEFQKPNGQENKYGYIAYFVVLVVWEVLPTYLVVLFFRVRIPHKDSLTSTGTVSTQAQNRKHFFDDPNRYDTETDELLGSANRSSHMAIPSQFLQAGYGSTASVPGKYPGTSSINQPTSGHSSYMPGTTPPQLFTAPTFFTDR